MVRILDKIEFIKKYENIKNNFSKEFEILDGKLEELIFCDKNENKKNQIKPILKEFLSNNGKKIRPLLIFLVTKAMGCEIAEEHYKLALAQECIHNATLIHDDIIDCSLVRRGKKTINFDYDSKLAVLTGDYLLCEALKILSSFENKIIDIHSNTMSKMIEGEIYQYFHRFKLCNIEDYVEKSKNKTAKLFESGILSCSYLNNCSDYETEKLSEFALNFGIAFQIQNDIENFENDEKLNEDISNGDFCAPLIFYAQEKNKNDENIINNPKQAIKQMKKGSAIAKTQELSNFYMEKAIENIAFIEDNLYKKLLIELCNLFIK